MLRAGFGLYRRSPLGVEGLLGLPLLEHIRFHDLRHSDATHLIAAGVHVKVVCSRLGHASASFTLDRYGHVLHGMGADAAAAVARLVDEGNAQ